MSKVKLYVKAAKSKNQHGKLKVEAGPRVNHWPISEQRDGVEVALPTVTFGVEIDVPDSMFAQAESVAAKVELTAEAGEVIVTPLVPVESEEA